MKMVKQCSSLSGNISTLTELQLEFISAFIGMTKLKEIHAFGKKNGTEFWFVLTDMEREDSLKYIKKSCLFSEEKNIDDFDCLILDEKQLDKSNKPEPMCSFYTEIEWEELN